MSYSAYFEIPEGKLYWTYDSPSLAIESERCRPTLLFIHAGVADLTLWDEQVSFFTAQGWGILRYDILGYGRSNPNQIYISQHPRPKVKHHDHVASIAKNLCNSQMPLTSNSEAISNRFIVVGLSRGGSLAVDFTLAYPDLVSALVVLAGGISGLDLPNTAEENALFKQENQLKEAKDIEGMARFNVRVWGDGPFSKQGRANKMVRGKLYEWGIDIATRDCNSTGAWAITYEEIDPPAAERLTEIKVPVAIGIGRFDETSTNGAMRYFHEHAVNSRIKEFDAAHMINLEVPDGFNDWLDNFLDQIMS
ncbi:hypothetical protein MMC12_006700 [Toensbergia leucococca]|nr:hypothetical protein [Toensbergia leucococca]